MTEKEFEIIAADILEAQNSIAADDLRELNTEAFDIFVFNIASNISITKKRPGSNHSVREKIEFWRMDRYSRRFGSDPKYVATMVGDGHPCVYYCHIRFTWRICFNPLGSMKRLWSSH